MQKPLRYTLGERERRNVQRRILDSYDMIFKNDDEFLEFIQQYDAVLCAFKNTLINR